MKQLIFIFVLILSILFLNSCSPFKNLKEGEVFLNSNKLSKAKSKLDTKESVTLKESIAQIIKPKTNKKLLGILRSRLFFYNLGHKEGADTTWKRKLFVNTLGEPPVILDTLLINKNVKSIKSFLHKEGFFNATVKDTIMYKRNHKVANVEYVIDGHEPYRIDSISFNISDPNLEGHIKDDCKYYSLIKQGDIFDEDELSKERDRMTYELKQRGYYYFSKEYINFIVPINDSLHKVNIVCGVKRINESKSAEALGLMPESHHVYYLKNIYVQTDYNARDIKSNKNLDTVLYNNIYFLSSATSPKYSYERLSQTIFLKKGNQYAIEKQEETNRRLSDLNYFKFINISIDSVHHDTVANNYELNVFIQLSPSKRQSMSIESEGTNQGSNKGISINADYRNKNTFSGFEMFDIRPKASVEAQLTQVGSSKTYFSFFNTLEYGMEMSMNFQKFLVPLSVIKNISQLSEPKSAVSASYLQQLRPDYQRSLSNFTYSQNWREPSRSIFKKYNISWVDINYVNSKLDPTFETLLKSYNDQAISNSYRPHITTDFNVSFTRKNQNINDKYKPYSFFYLAGEMSGFLPAMLYQPLFGLKPDSLGKHELFTQVYSRYWKFDVDGRYFVPKFILGNIALRGAVSVGIPVTPQTQTLPFEKAYYGGGANDIRGWIARTLGPGAYDKKQSLDQTGDIKLLLSEEYRFDMFWILQGAFFADEGNVWLMYDDPNRPGAQFDRKKFIREIAIGAGFGLRLNFNFFVIRFDEAWAVYDPSVPLAFRGINPIKYYSLPNLKINIGIGYPF